jgi:predicted ABC-type ATPase
MPAVSPPIFLMFAGPNGSGKSTITQAFRDRGLFPANYVNADEIAKTLLGSSAEIGYQAAQMAEVQRQELMRQKQSLAFETVMSHPSKLALLEQAKLLGYQVILVFVGTNNPQINVERVALRVQQGGHDVPIDKIIARYHRTLQLLPRAVELANTAYIFDNTQTAELILQVGNGLQNIRQAIPKWVETGLILPCAERLLARQAIESFARARNLKLEFASLVKANYVGEIMMQDSLTSRRLYQQYYGLQLVNGKSIAHDLSTIELPQPSASIIEISYDNGIATIRS